MIEVFVKKNNTQAIEEILFSQTTTEIAEEVAVASAVVAIIQTAILGLSQVAKIDFDYECDDRCIKIKHFATQNETQRIQTEAILLTLLCGVSDLQEAFSDFLKLEVH